MKSEMKNWFRYTDSKRTLHPRHSTTQPHMRMYFCIIFSFSTMLRYNADHKKVLEVSKLEEKCGKATKTPKQTP